MIIFIIVLSTLIMVNVLSVLGESTRPFGGNTNSDERSCTMLIGTLAMVLDIALIIIYVL